MKSLKFKLLALLICSALLLPMMFSCGEKADTGSTTAGDATEDAGATDPTTPEPTPEPTTPEPTEPPTTREPFVPEEGLSYWEQIEAELAHYGLAGGVKILPGEDEAALMKGFTTGGTSKEELDVSGDNVPFSAAYRVTTKADTTDFWNASYSRSFEKDVPVEIDDLIVGVLWVKGARLSETEKFMEDDDAAYYIAIKTATDNWLTEGNIEPAGEQYAEDEWQKVFFYGYVMNEESKSSNMQLQIFLGYGNQQIDIGGVIAYKFPWTVDNEAAALDLVWQ